MRVQTEFCETAFPSMPVTFEAEKNIRKCQMNSKGEAAVDPLVSSERSYFVKSLNFIS